MKNLSLFLILSLFISQCGYERIYSGKNLNLSIKNIKKENNIINNELSNALLEILSDNASDNIFDLEIQSKKFTNVKSKDSKGNPSVYVLKLETKIIAKDKTNKEYINIISEEMNYNNNDDKFELSQYIDQIEKILIKETVEEIIGYLADIK
jgi:hypothetical protein